MDYILEKLAEWISKSVGSVLNMMTAVFGQMMQPDMKQINAMFPDLGALFTGMQVVGGVLILVILFFQLLKIMMGSLSDSSESILKLVARSMLFLVLIMNADSLMNMIIGLAVEPYKYISNMSTAATTPVDFTKLSADAVTMGDTIAATYTATMNALPFSGGNILNIVLMVFIGWNYIKLLIELVERYLILGVMFYTSPIALATGGSEATVNIFKSWSKMLGSQLILMILNIWFLRVVNSGLGNVAGLSVADAETAVVGGKTMIMVGIGCMLRIAQRMDTYMAALGVNTAQTGQGLSADLAATAMTLKTTIGGATSMMFGGKGGLTNRIGNAMNGNTMGKAAAANALFKGSSVNGGADALMTMGANNRLGKNKLGSDEKNAVMEAFNGTQRKAVKDEYGKQVMSAIAPEFGKRNSLVGAMDLKNAVPKSLNAMTSSEAAGKKQFSDILKEGMANGKQIGTPGTTSNNGSSSEAGNGKSTKEPVIASPYGKNQAISSSVNASSIGTSVADRYRMSNIQTTGSGGVIGQMDVDGKLTNFAITRSKPSNGFAQQTTLADGSVGYVQYDNKQAVLSMADYGKGAYKVGDGEKSFTAYHGEEANQIMANMQGLDTSRYNSVSFGSDGQTLLGRADGRGMDQVMPLGAVAGDYENVDTFVGKNDGLMYGVQPYSGSAFSYVDDAMLNEGANGMFTSDTKLVESLNENYNFTAPVTTASVHYDEDNNLDYITVTDTDGGMARLHDPELVETEKEYGGFKVVETKETADAEDGSETKGAYVVVQDADEHGAFKGTGVKSKKKLWYETE